MISVVYSFDLHEIWDIHRLVCFIMNASYNRCLILTVIDPAAQSSYSSIIHYSCAIRLKTSKKCANRGFVKKFGNNSAFWKIFIFNS